MSCTLSSGRAGKLELAAGLQADAGAAAREADQGLAAVGAVLEDVAPAVALQPGEQGVDARLALIGHGPVAGNAEDELLVFGADAEIGLGLEAAVEVGDQVVEGQRAVATERVRHSVLPPAGRAAAPRHDTKRSTPLTRGC
jgi:hypothetical protein